VAPEDAADVSEATVAVVDAPAGRSVGLWLSWNMGAIRVIWRVRTSGEFVVAEPVNVTRSGNVDWALIMADRSTFPRGRR
jgi:hypothetical protein